MKRPRLTIGMACVDDFDGIYFTITSLLLHHAEAIKNCEILVIDNAPTTVQGKATANWVKNRVPSGRYVAYSDADGTAQARNEVFRHAKSPNVLCIDCHVLLAPGSLLRLIEYFENNPQSNDLLSGPLLTDSGRVSATDQIPQWSKGAWGVWHIDPRGADPENTPFEIWQQGMGLFACRKDAWVEFHPRFRGFGGCESYIMEKFRQRGGRVLCCPWLRWTHRFQRPAGVPYSVKTTDRIRNYLIGFEELGLDTSPVYEHFNLSRQQGAALLHVDESKPCRSDIAIVGNSAYGGVKMRGALLSRHLNAPLLSPHQVSQIESCETIVAVKHSGNGESLRSKCERLIYDPLDSFAEGNSHSDPSKYWRSEYQRLRFDDIIATSPACLDVMRHALPKEVRVHLVPHQHDSRVNATWHDPCGPIVYSGLDCFVASGLERIREACRMVGRELVTGSSVDALRGASLALALRMSPYDTPLHRHCKPQIKLENALAAGIPVVATDCPASRTLHPALVTVSPDFTAIQLADAMRKALNQPSREQPFSSTDYLTKMQRVLGRQVVMVYSAIFGGRDQLTDPIQTLSGVQYLCFTDNPHLRSDVWQIRYCPPEGSPLLQAKRIKVLAHEYLDCDLSIWLDGSLQLVNLESALNSLQKDIALQPHPARKCAFDEARYCLLNRRGNPERIHQAIERYTAEGHPKNYGLWRGGVVIRKHTPATKTFNEEWWREIEIGSSRDQISLPVVLRRLGIDFQTFPRNVPQYHFTHHEMRTVS